MGSRHNSYEFEETESFSSFALQEEPQEAFGYNTRASEEPDFGYVSERKKAKPAPSTFLQRLMGLTRRKEAVPLYPEMPKHSDKFSDKFSQSGPEDLEIPSFLRQKPPKK
jgi:hypothetical protein